MRISNTSSPLRTGSRPAARMVAVRRKAAEMQTHQFWAAATLAMCFQAAALAAAEPPELVSWIRNTTGTTGYAGLPANVQSVRYSEGNVYVSSSGIPAYSIGPWAGDPNIPSNQAFVF